MSDADQASTSGDESDSSFGSIFAEEGHSVEIKVPNYQRAYSWEDKQVGLFLSDLKDYEATGRPYYFGHYIVENRGNCWEIVDGQQRISTFVLFLIVCRHHHPFPMPAAVESLMQRFSTVSYDNKAFREIVAALSGYLARNKPFDPKHPPASDVLRDAFALTTDLSRSQRLLILALLQMNRAFRRDEMDRDKIPAYIDVVMKSHASRHLTRAKSVAVNVFEMHNTRGVPLTTLEVIKAVLMKFVYDRGESEEERNQQVEKIQERFGEIYRMEEHLAERSFRGKMAMEQLLRHHLRVVDDGRKSEARHFHTPAANANGEVLVEYVKKRLHFEDDEKSPRDPKRGVDYALDLTRELATSMKIVSRHLPEWDKDDAEHIVGDVLILEPTLSCEFFLIVCRRLESSPGAADGRLESRSLKLWERFLFVRDFHDAYYRLWYKDDFPKLFSELGNDADQITATLRRYLADGFRDQTKGLLKLVDSYLEEKRPNILNNAFHWWKGKMIYALYKYEVSRAANLRNVMKGTISVEHILPQEWQWKWIDGHPAEGELPTEEKERVLKDVGSFINGLGNLLLLTGAENTRVGNMHPADKRYPYQGGSYSDHNGDPERWRSSGNWGRLIEERGKEILEFMRRELISAPNAAEDSTADRCL